MINNSPHFAVLFSQIGDLLGIQQLLPVRSGRGYLYNVGTKLIKRISNSEFPIYLQRIWDIYGNLAYTNTQTMLISICSILFLLFTQQIFEVLIKSHN
jgi:hypothetical protein